MTRVLLCSTYALGAQPLGCARPAAHLKRVGHDVRVVDLSIDPLSDQDVMWAEAVAFSVPMHTAVRLGFSALLNVRALAPAVPVAFHGLYAAIALESGQFAAGDLIVAGDVDSALVEWADKIARNNQDDTVSVRVDIGKPRPKTDATVIPLRSGLPGLERYARLIGHGDERLVGAVETTHGCNHRCRHCPVPVVYDGRSRVIEVESILGDIDQLVLLGAEHIHFGDPDFLNRPEHARRIVDEMHRRHPHLTFDATIKVSHILRDPEVWSHFAEAGLIFVVSAFESTSDAVLLHLDKGHSADDLAVAVKLLRDAGIEPRPSLLPFTPWTTPDDLVELFDFVAREDLIENVDPVQYGIRLLLPPGSLLSNYSDPTIVASLRHKDIDGVAVTWVSADPLMDELAATIAAWTELAIENDEPTMKTYLALRGLLYQVIGRDDAGVPLVTEQKVQTSIVVHDYLSLGFVVPNRPQINGLYLAEPRNVASMNIPEDAHEWLSFEDEKEKRTWMIDVTFLESGWECIYGNGCQGIYEEAAPELVQGCCSYGAHFVDEKDVKHVENAAKKLTAEQWQMRSIGKKKGITKQKGGDTTTRVVDGACIFLNRPGFAGGPGCALHRAALDAGYVAMKWKPEVCWQLPLRREDSVDDQGHVISRVTEWKRRNWGPAGEDFHWWCTEDPAAFTSKIPVFESMANELRELVGKSAYRQIVAALNARRDQRVTNAAVALPHPTVRHSS